MSAGGGWTRVEHDLVTAHGLDAAYLYGLLRFRCDLTGSWRATTDDLAAASGLTRHAVRRAVGVLRDAGLITSDRTDRWDAALSWRISAGHADSAESDTSRVQDRTTSRVSDRGTSDLPESDTSLSPKNLKNPPLPPGGADDALFGAEVGPRSPQETPDDLPGFDAWWALYPRKVAKGDARKAWRQVTRVTSPDVIHAGLTRQVADLTEQAARGFCPYPATWLRAERWADQTDNVTHLPTRPDLAADYDPAYAATLPPPRTDPFAAGGRW